MHSDKIYTILLWISGLKSTLRCFAVMKHFLWYFPHVNTQVASGREGLISKRYQFTFFQERIFLGKSQLAKAIAKSLWLTQPSGQCALTCQQEGMLWLIIYLFLNCGCEKWVLDIFWMFLPIPSISYSGKYNVLGDSITKERITMLGATPHLYKILSGGLCVLFEWKSFSPSKLLFIQVHHSQNPVVLLKKH